LILAEEHQGSLIWSSPPLRGRQFILSQRPRILILSFGGDSLLSSGAELAFFRERSREINAERFLFRTRFRHIASRRSAGFCFRAKFIILSKVRDAGGGKSSYRMEGEKINSRQIEAFCKELAVFHFSFGCQRAARSLLQSGQRELKSTHSTHALIPPHA
jgi:hypothetical protein